MFDISAVKHITNVKITVKLFSGRCLQDTINCRNSCFCTLFSSLKKPAIHVTKHPQLFWLLNMLKLSISDVITQCSL